MAYSTVAYAISPYATSPVGDGFPWVEILVEAIAPTTKITKSITDPAEVLVEGLVPTIAYTVASALAEVLVEAPAPTNAGTEVLVETPAPINAGTEVLVEAIAPTFHLTQTAALAEVLVEAPAPQIAVPAISSTASIAPPTVGLQIPASFAATASIEPPSIFQLSIIDRLPEDGAVVPVLRPYFGVTLYYFGTESVLDVEVQYDTNSAFPSPVSLTTTAILLTGEGPTLLRPGSNLTNGQTYYWRARAGKNGSYTAWTSTYDFSMDTTVGPTQLDGSWIVGVGTPDPHIWFVSPGQGKAGDVISIYGRGFLSASAVVKFGVTTATVNSWTQVSASGDAYGVNRSIDVSGKSANIEYEVLDVVVPSITPPGGSLYVEGP